MTNQVGPISFCPTLIKVKNRFSFSFNQANTLHITRNVFAAYILVLIIILLALLMNQYILSLDSTRHSQFLIFVAAVVINAWYGGLKPGLLTTLIALLLIDYLYVTPRILISNSPSDNLRLLLFTGEGILISILSELRLRAEESSIVSRRQIENILESINDAFISYDRKWRVTYLNKKAEELAGKKKEDLIGKNIWKVSPESAKSIFFSKYKHAMEHRKTQEFEAYSPLVKRWVFVRAYPSPAGLSVYFADISKLKEVDKQKDEFSSLVVHELKSPVSTINGYMQLLENHAKEQHDKKSLEYLDMTSKQVHRLMSLINGLLNASRMRATGFDFKYRLFDLSDLVQKTIRNLQTTSPTHTIVSKGSDQVMVYADPERIEQVLVNLILNAIKYSPNANKVIVTTKVDKRKLTIGIQDFGIGISKKYQKKVFERFFQAKSIQTKDTLYGIGLGLDITSQIIKHHGGKIWLQSTEGQGSTFYFTLPLKKQKTN